MGLQAASGARPRWWFGFALKAAALALAVRLCVSGAMRLIAIAHEEGGDPGPAVLVPMAVWATILLAAVALAWRVVDKVIR